MENLLAMDKSGSKNRLLIMRYFFIIFMIVGALLTGTISVLYNLETKEYLSRLQIEEQTNLNLQTELIAHSLEDVVSDLKFLSRQNELAHMLENDGEGYKDEIAREYSALSRRRHVSGQKRGEE